MVNISTERHQYWMSHCLALAENVATMGDIPVAALVVATNCNGEDVLLAEGL